MKIQPINLFDPFKCKYLSALIVVVVFKALVGHLDKRAHNFQQILIIIFGGFCEDRIHAVVKDLHIALSCSRLELLLPQEIAIVVDRIILQSLPNNHPTAGCQEMPQTIRSVKDHLVYLDMTMPDILELAWQTVLAHKFNIQCRDWGVVETSRHVDEFLRDLQQRLKSIFWHLFTE